MTTSNYKKIANKCHEEIPSLTTRSYGKHGLKKGLVRDKRARNRTAKRADAKEDLKTQE